MAVTPDVTLEDEGVREITKLEDKRFGIQTRTKAKALPWAYLAFATIFLGLNVAGLTTNLGAGFFGPVAQGPIVGATLGQTIANGAFLLAQGTAVAGIALALPAVYAGIRNIVSYSRFKKAMKTPKKIRAKVVAGVVYDKELQQTEKIINSMLPSRATASSYMELALSYREKFKLTKHPIKKAYYREKYTWYEDVVRRSIVQLTNRLAELSQLQNKGWKSYDSTSRLSKLTTSEQETRKTEMFMIQKYLYTILNKCDKTDPYFTTLLSQIKKHRIDKANKDMVGIYLVPEPHRIDPSAKRETGVSDDEILQVANEVNDAVFNNDHIKRTLINFYNEADNDLEHSLVSPTDAIGRALADMSLRRAEDAADQAERASESATADAYVAHQHLNEIERIAGNVRISGASTISEMTEIRSNAVRILETLKNTLRNTRRKKQNINQLVRDAEQQLVDLGITKASAETACQTVLDNARTSGELVDEIREHGTSAEEARRKAESSARGAEKSRRQAQSSADKTRNVQQQINDIKNQMIALLSDANLTKREIDEVKANAVSALRAIGADKDMAESFVNQIQENLEISKKHAKSAEENAEKAEKHAENTEKNAKRTAQMADEAKQALSQLRQYANTIKQIKESAQKRNFAIKNYSSKTRKELTTLLNQVKNDITALNAEKEQIYHILAEIKDNGLTSSETTDTILRLKDLALTAQNEINAKLVEANNAVEEISAELGKAKTQNSEIQQILDQAQKIQTKISRISKDVTNKYTRFVDHVYTVEEFMEELENNKNNIEALIAIIENYKNAGNDISGKLTTIYESALKTQAQIVEAETKAQKSAKEAEESAKHARSHEQSVEQIRNRMSQLENTTRQVLTNIKELYYNLKTTKKVETAELVEAKTELQNTIKDLNDMIAEAKENTVAGTTELTALKNEANALLDDIKTAESKAQKSAKEIEQSKEKIIKFASDLAKKYDQFVADYSKTRDNFESIGARISALEYDLRKDLDVSDQIKQMQTDISYLLLNLSAIEKQDEELSDRIDMAEANIAILDIETAGKIAAIEATISKYRKYLEQQAKKLDTLKTIKKASPEKEELKAVIEEIKKWSRLICWATENDKPEIKKESLSAATTYVKSRISGPSKKTPSAINYSDSEIIGEALNDFLGTSYPDVTKLSLAEARQLLSKIEREVNNYNNRTLGSGNNGSTI